MLSLAIENWKSCVAKQYGKVQEDRTRFFSVPRGSARRLVYNSGDGVLAQAAQRGCEVFLEIFKDHPNMDVALIVPAWTEKVEMTYKVSSNLNYTLILTLWTLYIYTDKRCGWFSSKHNSSKVRSTHNSFNE